MTTSQIVTLAILGAFGASQVLIAGRAGDERITTRQALAWWAGSAAAAVGGTLAATV